MGRAILEKALTAKLMVSFGKTAAEANVAATNAGLLVRFSGATQTTSGNIRVLSQSLEAGQQVPAGTVITVQLGDANMTD